MRRWTQEKLVAALVAQAKAGGANKSIEPPEFKTYIQFLAQDLLAAFDDNHIDVRLSDPRSWMYVCEWIPSENWRPETQAAQAAYNKVLRSLYGPK